MRRQKTAFIRPLLIPISVLLLAAACPSQDGEAPAEPEAPAAEQDASAVEPAVAEQAAPEPEAAAEPEAAPEPDADADAEAAEGTADEEAEAEVKEVSSMEELVACLDHAGVRIYGAVTCPFCTQLADAFGGYDVVGPIYVECTEQGQRCRDEMLGRGVPEIQIRGEMYRGGREPAAIGEAAGCKLVQ